MEPAPTSTPEICALMEVLSAFTHSSHPVMKSVFTVRNYRGDCTAINELWLRSRLGDVGYESFNSDTVACNGRIMVIVPRSKLPGAVKAPFGFRLLPAQYHWALSQVDKGSLEVTPASETTRARVASSDMERLKRLPGLELVDVRNVLYYEHANGEAKPKIAPAPQTVIYFRFANGLGVVVPAVTAS